MTGHKSISHGHDDIIPSGSVKCTRITYVHTAARAYITFTILQQAQTHYVNIVLNASSQFTSQQVAASKRNKTNERIRLFMQAVKTYMIFIM